MAQRVVDASENREPQALPTVAVERLDNCSHTERACRSGQISTTDRDMAHPDHPSRPTRLSNEPETGSWDFDTLGSGNDLTEPRKRSLVDGDTQSQWQQQAQGDEESECESREQADRYREPPLDTNHPEQTDPCGHDGGSTWQRYNDLRRRPAPRPPEQKASDCQRDPVERAHRSTVRCGSGPGFPKVRPSEARMSALRRPQGVHRSSIV